MLAAQVAERVGDDEGRVGASLWKTGGSAEVEGTRDGDLRQTIGIDAVVDPEVRRISCAFGVKVMLMRLKPKRASLTRLGPKMWVSFRVKICRRD